MTARLRHIALSVPDPEKAAVFFEFQSTANRSRHLQCFELRQHAPDFGHFRQRFFWLLG